MTKKLMPPISLTNRAFRELQDEFITAPKAKTICVSDGSLWFDGFNTITYNHEGHVIKEARAGYSEVVQYGVRSTPSRRLSGRISLLGNRGAHNYYHWMNDVLPRLAVLRASGYPLDSIDTFVTSPLRHEFQYETLQHFGIGKDRLHAGYSHVSANDILLPLFGSNSLGLNQGLWAPEFLQKEFGPTAEGGTTNRLYISRGSNGARGISNETELVELLDEYGFIVVKPEEHTVREQAAMFAAADIVLGPHGAGLSNIAFCKPYTSVVELFNNHIQPCFWALSCLLQHRHYVHHCNNDYVVGDMSDETYHQSADARRVSTFAVQTDDIRSLIDKVIADRNSDSFYPKVA